MTPSDFCNWLRGYFELCDNATLNKEQVARIRQRLESVQPEVKVTAADIWGRETARAVPVPCVTASSDAPRPESIPGGPQA